VQILQPCPPQLYRQLYLGVGTPYGWRDRAAWSDGQIQDYLAQAGLYVWGSYWAGEICGYVELRARAGTPGQIVYLGLFPGFEGRGMGKHLLSLATQTAWELGCSCVLVNTLTTDGPYALENYLRRGFQIERQVNA